MKPFRSLQIMLSEGLRFFFLAAVLYAVFAMGVWEGWLGVLPATGQAPAMPFAPSPVMWHAHEMIFGYACAVLGGFFLTAVPSWTGEKSARGAFLTLLTVLWPGGAASGLRLGLLTVTAVIAIIGGRVIPAFTRNAMRQAGREIGLPQSRAKIEMAGIGLAVLLPLLVAADADNRLIAAVALMTGAAQATRLAGWSSRWALGQPIMWSLHLAFATLALGYLALAAAMAGWIDEIGALHLLGVGAIGGMTLAMMSRAALGHTGRPLIAARPVVWAYGLIALASLIRAAGAEAAPGWYDWAVLISGALWLVAFGMFLAIYWPILTRPRHSTAT